MKRTIVNAIIYKGQRVLCVKRLHKPFSGMYHLPGGHKKPQETDLEALQREVKEETGLVIQPAIRPIGNIHYPVGDDETYDVIYYAAHVLPGEPISGPDVAEVKWMTTRELFGNMAQFIPLQYVQQFKQVILAAKKK